MPAIDPYKFDVSVVIVNYNTKYLTEKCIKSIEKNSGQLEIQIVVVDNCSQDNSYEYLKNKFPHFEILRSDRNGGFAYGNNVGFAICRGELILCLNPDTEVFEDTFPSTVEFLRSHPDVGLVGVRLVDGKGQTERSSLRFPSLYRTFMQAIASRAVMARLPKMKQPRYEDHDEQSVYECDAVVGCFMLVRSAVVDQCGGMDARIFMYGEEVEWCWRIRKSGWQIVYYGKSMIFHHDGASTRGMSRWKLIEMARGQLESGRLMRGQFFYFSHLLVLIIHDALRLPFYLVREILFRDSWGIDRIHRLKFLFANFKIKSSDIKLRFLKINLKIRKAIYRSIKFLNGKFGFDPKFDSLVFKFDKSGSLPVDSSLSYLRLVGAEGIQSLKNFETLRGSRAAMESELRKGAVYHAFIRNNEMVCRLLEIKKAEIGNWFVQLKDDDSVIYSVVTNPKWRGRGVAGTLTSMVAQQCQQQGGDCYLDCEAWNTVAHSAFRKAGFEQVRIQTHSEP